MTAPRDGRATRAIHAGQGADPTTGAVVPPIHLSSTFRQDGVGVLRSGYEYSRSGNPTRDALQGALASLEGGERAFAFASGLAAEDTLLRSVLRPGGHVVLPDDAYGGTWRLVAKVLAPWGIEHSTARLDDPAAVAAVV
ncbi:MAG TPA: PLP-dependent transferase, partial [Actinotalea sp.]|nr:PLP-dependent transferase [Actinotalea sp.]